MAWFRLVKQPGIHGGKVSLAVSKYVGFGCGLHIRQLMVHWFENLPPLPVFSAAQGVLFTRGTMAIMALTDAQQPEQVHLQLDQRFYRKVSAASFGAIVALSQ